MFMKKIYSSLLSVVLLSFMVVDAQVTIKEKKYPSLLWEIKGKGLSKPSYLIGTMHVSSKLAFNLPDSFYIAVKNAQVVALETNPETWQEDMTKYELGFENYMDAYAASYGSYSRMPDEYMGIHTLKFDKYAQKIEKALYSNPSAINNLLYRSYGNEASDFEEDTFLDMYIYQCGKKWGKKVAGVENYGESMQLMAEAYRDAVSDTNRKERSYGDIDDDYSMYKLQEAYRTGNLDLLDSINKYNSVSKAFDEKFLYQRNYIQANSIDSILKTGASLFVGVGAAHLPGERGVIEILREKGYQLRPVKMGERASKEKEMVEKIRVPVIFNKVVAEDGLYEVELPGKFYRLGEEAGLNLQQYADMANGSYYMVTRIMTNAWMWGHTEERMLKVIDSLLYENIPGKIISKTPVVKNGYKGFDIVNRTRRGDVQRYNIIATPFEVFVFKMSGTGDYVKDGEEAQKFFGSIQLKETKTPETKANWLTYSPSYGGFSVEMPHTPYSGAGKNFVYDAADKVSGSYYRVIRTVINNYSFAGEDTFDLGLMDESFMASEFIEKQLSRKQTTHKGYPALEASYRDKNGDVFQAKFIIQGPYYYTLIAHGKKGKPEAQRFFNSFEITPFRYTASKTETDTSLYFTVKNLSYKESDKIKLDIPAFNLWGGYDEEEKDSEDDQLEAGVFRSRIVANDSTGEKIYVTFYRSPRYHYEKDSSSFFEPKKFSYRGDSTWIVKKQVRNTSPGNNWMGEIIFTDTGSSRSLWLKSFYKDGIVFTLTTQTDTLTRPSDFIKTFYETFQPADTLKGANVFQKKSSLFFSDFTSGDSVLRKRALKNIEAVEFDSTDFRQLKQLVQSLSWKEKKYLDTKESLIEKLGEIPAKEVSDYLKQLYFSLDDTIQLQYAVLKSIVSQQTAYSYAVFRDIVNAEPPILDIGTSEYDYSYKSTFLDGLSDSLELAKQILPDLLPLVNLEDYKEDIMSLLVVMIDSSMLKTADYEAYFSKFMLEAKQELKKQSIAEKRKALKEAEQSKVGKKPSSNYYKGSDTKDYGNAALNLYASLLMPFWDEKPAVQPWMDQLVNSADKRLKYATMLLYLKNNKKVADTLLKYFAGLDEYRFELYKDLKSLKKSDLFPAAYNNHADLAKSSLLDEVTYEKPDSIVFLDKVSTVFEGKKGWVYFYKYREKKDDVSWKIASVGLVPENPGEFLVPLPAEKTGTYKATSYERHLFTRLSDTKLKEDEPVRPQLEKALKRLLYGEIKSGSKFYEAEGKRASWLEHMMD